MAPLRLHLWVPPEQGLLSLPVSGTSTGKKKKLKKKTVTDPSSQRSLTGPGSYKIHRAIYTYKHTKTDYLRRRQNLPISVRQRWQALWEGPHGKQTEVILFSQPSSPLPLNTLGDSFRAPCVWRRTVDKLLRGGRLDINEAPTSQWYTCHIILQRTDNTQHTVCWRPACATQGKAWRNMLWREYITCGIKDGHMVRDLIKHLGNAEYMCSGCWWFGLMA